MTLVVLAGCGGKPDSAPPGLADRIVPYDSIGRVRIGMGEDQVRQVLGAPDGVVTESDDAGKLYRYYSYRRGPLSSFEFRERFLRGFRVVGLDTRSRSVRTADGLGVGTRRSELPRRLAGGDCTVSSFELGTPVWICNRDRRQTAFFLERGRVMTINILGE